MFYKTSIYLLKIKCFYGLGQIDKLENVLGSFREFLGYDAGLNMNEDIIIRYKKFISVIKKMINAPLLERKALKEKIRADVSLIERDWLLNI